MASTSYKEEIGPSVEIEAWKLPGESRLMERGSQLKAAVNILCVKYNKTVSTL
jgi:hypothetical protein